MSSLKTFCRLPLNRRKPVHTVHLSKESFKFSSAHFTVFNASQAERLHGHNYYVSVDLQFSDFDKSTDLTIDFHKLKKDIQKSCDYLDEYVLIPKNSSFLSYSKIEQHTQIQFSEKRYLFPDSDIRLLPLANITCEGLCKYLLSLIHI